MKTRDPQGRDLAPPSGALPARRDGWTFNIGHPQLASPFWCARTDSHSHIVFVRVLMYLF